MTPADELALAQQWMAENRMVLDVTGGAVGRVAGYLSVPGWQRTEVMLRDPSGEQCGRVPVSRCCPFLRRPTAAAT